MTKESFLYWLSHNSHNKHITGAIFGFVLFCSIFLLLAIPSALITSWGGISTWLSAHAVWHCWVHPGPRIDRNSIPVLNTTQHLPSHNDCFGIVTWLMPSHSSSIRTILCILTSVTGNGFKAMKRPIQNY